MDNDYSCLELTIAMPGFSSSSSLPTPENPEEEEDECWNMNGPRKKLRLTKEQSLLLEESFIQNQTLNLRQKEILAQQLHLKQRQVEVWFQNRRARNKMKQTEMECEYMKRWFGSLTEQNRKLQMEVEKLRAVKACVHLQPPPAPSTLTMCPRCERVTANMPFQQPRRQPSSS